MNKISRLTALLLALMMIFSTAAAAETSYQVGQMTTDQWQQMVENAEDKLYVVDEGDSGQTVTPQSPEQAEHGEYYLYSDGVTAALADEAVSCQISASGVAILTNASAGQWQMKIGSSWVNIAGETGAALSVTGAMMNGMTTAEVRKALAPKDEATGEYSAFTEAATVEIVEVSPAALFSMSRAETSAAENNGGETTAPYSLQRANDGTTYTVVIEYVFENGSPAAAAWGASLGAGTNLNDTIVNPNVVGYKPKDVMTISPAGFAGVTYTPATVAAEDDAANGIKIGDVTDPGSVNLAITGIDQHITVTVTYEPTLVDYTVIHKQQNTDNDNYTEVERVTERGLTGSIVPEKDIARSYNGFYNLLYEQPTIAANGSTVVEISYDRYYYLISFELSGGYGVDPVYGRFGAEVGDVGIPTRPGYEFLGWNVDVPETIPAGHMVITALWKPLDNFYTVVYWTKNVDDDEYSYWDQHYVASISGTSLIPSEVGEVNSAEKAGLDKAGYFKYDAAATAELNDDDKEIIVAGDGSTVVNVYYSRNSYTIRFIYTREKDGKYYLADLTGCGTYNNVHPSNANHNLVSTSWYKYSVPTAPVVNPAFADKTGSFTEDGYTYHYIYMTAEYGANLETIWPAAPLPKTGSYYFGSWGAQCGSPYRVKYGNDHANIVGAYPVMSEELIMDPANPIAQTMVAWWAQSGANVSAHTYHIYFEALPGQERDKRYGGVDYVHVSDIPFTCAHNGSTRVDPFEYAGYTCVNDTRDTGYDKQSNSSSYYHNDDCPNDGRNNQCAYCNVFYYKRDRYTLSFYNYNKESDKPADKTLMFGESFSSYRPAADPAYPEGAEPGALTFMGWYTTPEAYEGTEVNWNGTMPEGNVTFYAKWVPNTYTVRFFLTEELMETGLDANVYNPTMALDEADMALFRNVLHGTQIDQDFVDRHLDYNAMTENDGPFAPYTFIAWFYYDENGVKQPFEPATQIKQDLDVFAEWSSDVLIAYTIKYAVPKKNADGSYVLDQAGNRVVDYYVAADTTGSALAGTSKTFEAKGGADLFADYQTGCFPETESHTIRFSEEHVQSGAEYIFWYTDQVKVPYKVYYVTEKQDADNPLTEEKIGGVTYYRLKEPKLVSDNENAVVTETFETVSGYMPDAYQKRLVVTNDGNPDNDVIIFIYTKDEKHAYYRVTHYIENLETDASGNTTWTEYTSSQFVGDIGETTEYNDDPLQISGFKAPAETYVVGNVVTQGSPDNVATLTEDGMQINLYYEREVYPYKVQYLLENTTQELVPSKTGREKYEKTVAESAPTGTDYPVLNQYELVTSSPQSLTIRIEEDPNGEPKLNIITFYYREKTATINYRAVCPENENARNFGTVNPETEELSVLSGVAKGSEATAGENYSFAGWYSDENCTTLLSDDARFVPTKAADALWTEGTTYYAKFVENDVVITYVAALRTDSGVELETTTGGKVDLNDAADNGAARATETIKVESGAAAGAAAEPNDHYVFVGWYRDEACTDQVSADVNYVPEKENGLNVEGTYYALFEEKQATINYVVVGPTGCGTVDPESETIDMVTGVPAGSEAKANQYYRFVGWYDNAECEGEALSVEARYVPEKDASAVWPEVSTYYAKFEEIEVTLNYDVVTGCEQMGSVSPEEEIVEVLTGTPEGSTAAANTNYEFVGWYANAEGSGDALSTDVHYVPTKAADETWADGATYYAKFKEKQATINYVVVGPTGCGTVSPASETVDVVTGVPAGSTAAANETFTFVGWYTDEACTQPADAAWVVNGKITPTKAQDAAWADGTTYYARFEHLPGQLDIVKTVVNNMGEPLTVTEFEFTVTLKDAANNPLTGEVTYMIDGNPTTVTLVNGTFTLKLDVGPMDGSVTGQTRTVSASILNLPHGTKYAVTEAAVDNCTITYEGATGAIEATLTRTASFLNTFPAAPDSTLTVRKTGMNAGETAIIKVVVDGKTFMLALSSEHPTAVIDGLPIGSTYTVAEVDEWTWLYNPQSEKQGTILKDGSTVDIANTRKTDKWLHDESSIINNVTDGSSESINNH